MERNTINTSNSKDKYANRGTPKLMSVDSLVGNDIHNLQGDDLGGIKDMMLDISSGKVAYVVLSFGGIFGMGDKLFAVPWSALTLDTKNKRFTLDADKDKLKNAPGFNKAEWPDMADQTWGMKIHSYYGAKHYGEARNS